MRKRVVWMVGMLAGAVFLYTLGLAGIAPPPPVAQAGASVKINEFLPDPTAGPDSDFEFVELINTGDASVDLTGWKIDDSENSDGPYPIAAGTVMAPGQILSFLTGSKFALNNTGGDSVRLLDPSGAVIFATAYTVSHPNKSYNRQADDSFAEGEPTPGQPNAGAPVNQPPVAVITGPSLGLTGQSLVFSGSNSSDPEGAALTYAWNFGDGTLASNGVSVNHAFAAANSYTVTLAISDGVNTAQAASTVAVSAPVFSSALVINEFLPDPAGADAGNEFVELFNTGDVAVDVGGWKLDDIENGGSAPWVIPAGSAVAARGFLALHPGITLNNDTDNVRLLAPDGSVKAQTSYTTTTEGQSHNRKDDGSYALSTTLTPGAANIFTGVAPETDAETVYPDGIVVNEFLPNPEGSDSEGEFIEIKNTSGAAIDIGGWKLDDGEGGSSPFAIPAGKVLGAGAIIHFLSSQTHISLGNSGDTVRVLDPAGKTKSSVFYSSSHEGVSWARSDSGQMLETTTLTPGGSNIITPVEETTSSSSSSSSSSSKSKSSGGGKVEAASASFVALENVKQLKDGTEVITEGVVSAPPGVFGDKLMYLAGSGIQLYSSKGFSPLALGERVRVTGKLSTNGGERRLLLGAKTDAVKVGIGEVPQAHEIKTDGVGETWEGSLVSISGKVVKSSGDTFYLDDGSGPARVFIRDATGIQKPRLTKGTAVSVTGIVSQTKSGYRIMPRLQDDVYFGVRPKAGSSGAKKSSAGGKKIMAASLVCPSPSASAQPSATVCESQQVTQSSLLVSNSLVFVACLAAMGLMISGVRANEPLLTLTSKAR